MREESPVRVTLGMRPTPLAWLRENGRYVAGFGLRNWLGVHLLFGGVIMLGVSLSALMVALLQREPAFPLFDFVPFNWWSLPLLVALVWLVPVAGAYWITRDIGSARSKDLRSDTKSGPRSSWCAFSLRSCSASAFLWPDTGTRTAASMAAPKREL